MSPKKDCENNKKCQENIEKSDRSQKLAVKSYKKTANRKKTILKNSEKRLQNHEK